MSFMIEVVVYLGVMTGKFLKCRKRLETLLTAGGVCPLVKELKPSQHSSVLLVIFRTFIRSVHPVGSVGSVSVLAL